MTPSEPASRVSSKYRDGGRFLCLSMRVAMYPVWHVLWELWTQSQAHSSSLDKPASSGQRHGIAFFIPFCCNKAGKGSLFFQERPDGADLALTPTGFAEGSPARWTLLSVSRRLHSHGRCKFGRGDG